MISPTESPPRGAVDHFGPVTAGLTWHRAPPGFSGAVVWRGDEPSGTPRVALKGWPLGTAPERVREVHAWMATASALPFVPTVFRGAHGSTAAFADGRLWDACRWQPGAPLAVPDHPTVRAACEALAQLHLALPATLPKRPCAAVAGRLRLLLDNRDLFAPGTVRLPFSPQLDALLARSTRAVERLAGAAVEALRPWATRPVEIRPCVRDLRGEHVLFAGARVTGIVDYGAMSVDTSAGDLGRLLGDFSDTAPNLFDEGLSAYRRAGGPLDVPDEFVRRLATTGALCSLLGWLVRLFVLREPVTAPDLVAQRINLLLARVERLARI